MKGVSIDTAVGGERGKSQTAILGAMWEPKPGFRFPHAYVRPG
eukprot:COSAG06_NODE_49928_length_322_cov_0.690583_1_plen_42_part_01